MAAFAPLCRCLLRESFPEGLSGEVRARWRFRRRRRRRGLIGQLPRGATTAVATAAATAATGDGSGLLAAGHGIEIICIDCREGCVRHAAEISSRRASTASWRSAVLRCENCALQWTLRGPGSPQCATPGTRAHRSLRQHRGQSRQQPHTPDSAIRNRAEMAIAAMARNGLAVAGQQYSFTINLHWAVPSRLLRASRLSARAWHRWRSGARSRTAPRTTRGRDERDPDRRAGRPAPARMDGAAVLPLAQATRYPEMVGGRDPLTGMDRAGPSTRAPIPGCAHLVRRDRAAPGPWILIRSSSSGAVAHGSCLVQPDGHARSPKLFRIWGSYGQARAHCASTCSAQVPASLAMAIWGTLSCPTCQRPRDPPPITRRCRGWRHRWPRRCT
jgi:hypothetical protein